ncbi:ubiquinol-cytochrome c reductase iron-sulfur subunit [bacterium]|nr:ubiquinol-cytochrome c reductase iron-sulfur subunit [bacterium]
MNMRAEKSGTQGESGRRDFLKKAWKILGLVAAAELVFFFISLLKPSKELKKSKPGTTVRIIGNIEEFLPGTVTPDRINKLYIVRDSEGGFLALSLICPHLGCSVLWDETKKQFDCPCHSSAFDSYGIVLNSPAPRPLDYFPVILEEGKVKVDLSQKEKRRKFETSQMTYAI